MIVVLLINSAGLFCFYLVQRNEIRNNMFAWLKTGEADRFCTLLDLPVNAEGNIESRDFRWELNNREFVYNGGLYDVISIRINKGHASIRCVADKAEDHLIQKLRTAFEHQKEGKSRTATALLKFFSAFISVKNTVQVPSYEPSFMNPVPVYSFRCSCGVYEINTPPPEIG